MRPESSPGVLYGCCHPPRQVYSPAALRATLLFFSAPLFLLFLLSLMHAFPFARACLAFWHHLSALSDGNVAVPILFSPIERVLVLFAVACAARLFFSPLRHATGFPRLRRRPFLRRPFARSCNTKACLVVFFSSSPVWWNFESYFRRKGCVCSLSFPLQVCRPAQPFHLNSAVLATALRSTRRNACRFLASRCCTFRG